jgi:hypothetical protein
VFEGLKRRLQTRRSQRQELELLRTYHAGFHARRRGVPCTPPEECYVSIAIDHVGSWTAGWEAADKEKRGGGRTLV